MKHLLILLIFIPGLAKAQTTTLAAPGGGIISTQPGTAITQASGMTQFYTQTVYANTLPPNRYMHLLMECKVTTPTLGVPGLSVAVAYAGTSYNFMSSAALIGGVTGGLLTFDCYLVGGTGNTANIYIHIYQPSTALLTYSPSTINQSYTFTADPTVNNTFTVSMQFTGASLGTSSLVNSWLLRDAF